VGSSETAGTEALRWQVTPSVFPNVGSRLSDLPEFVRAYADVKRAAAEANGALGVLPPDAAAAVAAAAEELATTSDYQAFDVPVVQGGGGTETNLLINAVIADRANARRRLAGLPADIHPLDHVNRSQSTNDTYPTAQALATQHWARPALAQLAVLREALQVKARDNGDLLHLGRTCLQDAVPLTTGQTHQAQADAVRRVTDGLADAVSGLLAVPLGATAIGTGIGAPERFSEEAVSRLRALTGLAVRLAGNPFDSLAHLDGYSAVASACARVALVLGKLAQDLRILTSGPVGGFGEITLPKLLQGSSIMPGKVNPVVPELVLQYCFAVRGSAHTVDLAVAAGELELNVMEPVILSESHRMLELVAAGAGALSECVAGLVWNEDRVRRNLSGSVGEAVEAQVVRGYDEVAAELGAGR
jgi:aspartate ammonia-lyase